MSTYPLHISHRFNKDIKTKDGKTIIKHSLGSDYGDTVYLQFSDDSQFSSEDEKNDWCESFTNNLFNGDTSQLDDNYSYVIIYDSGEQLQPTNKFQWPCNQI